MQMTQREEFERWFKYDFHPDKTGPYVKDQLWFAWQAAKSALLTLPDRMDYELHGDSVIDSHHNTFADGYNECLSDVIAMNEEYANSTGSDGWIPVSERLPEQSQLGSTVEYLVYETLNNKVQHDYYIVPGDGTSPFWNYYQDHVTDWMPLPAAPEQPE